MIQQKKIILASQSPRRQELLKQLGIEFDIQVLSIDETYPSDLSPYDVPEYLAKLKSEEFNTQKNEETCIITSDTVVIYDGKILGKPKDEKDALEILKSGLHLIISKYVNRYDSNYGTIIMVQRP